MPGNEPTVQAFGGVAGRVFRGTLSAGTMLSGFVVITGLSILGYILREVEAQNAFLVLAQITTVVMLSRFARNGFAGEWEGTLFSSRGGTWLDVGVVALRYTVLSLVWLLPILLLGWRPEALAGVFGALVMGGEGGGKILSLTAIFLTLTALTPPLFLIVSVGAERFSDIVDQRHWRRLFQGRGGDLLLIYALYVGALGMTVLLSLPLFAVLARNAQLAFFLGFFILAFAAGLGLDLLGRLCGFFVACEDEERPGEEPLPAPHESRPAPGHLRLVTTEPAPLPPREHPALVASPPPVSGGTATKVLSPTGKPPLLDARERVDELERRLTVDSEGAIAALAELHESYAPHPLVLHRLCLALAKHGRKQDSLHMAREALALCLERGAQRLAAEIYALHFDCAEDFALTRDTVLMLAQDLRRHGDLVAAERAFQSIVDRDRGERRAVKGLLQVAEDHLVRSDYAEAQRLFRMLLERCGDSPLAMHMQDGLSEAERRLSKAS